MDRQAERITPPLAYHGEGPFWDHSTRRLLFMDVLAGAILAVRRSGEISRHQVPSRAATFLRRRASGGFVVAAESELVSCDDQFEAFGQVADLAVAPDVRTNDGACDPLGALIVGTMAYDGRPGAGNVYRVTSDRRVSVIVEGVTISNGVQWSADGRRVFYIDTPTRGVDVFDVDPGTGAWTNRRLHIDCHELAGSPDGMAIDDEDGLWIAMWGGGVVEHFDDSGRHVETIAVPGVTQVSSCAFGGDDGDVLFVTTSRQGLADDQEPAAGAVFSIQTDSRGQVPWEYAG